MKRTSRLVSQKLSHGFSHTAQAALLQVNIMVYFSVGIPSFVLSVELWVLPSGQNPVSE